MNSFGKWIAIGIVVLILVMGYFIYAQNRQIHKLEEKYVNYSLLKGSVLPANVLSDIEILKNTITELKRVSPDSVYITTSYVPTESEVHYVTEVDTTAWNTLLDIAGRIAYLEASGDTTGLAELRGQIESLQSYMFTTTVEFDNKGSCLEPVVGLGLNNSLGGEVVAGVRLLYWNRLGAGLHGTFNFTSENLGVGVGGFVDSRIPRLNNVGVFIGGGYDITNSCGVMRIGLQGYLN